MRPSVERSNGTGPLSLCRFCQDCIIATRGYDFWEGQLCQSCRGCTIAMPGYSFREPQQELAPQELRRRVGMVMQAAYLFPGTVAENVAFGPRQRGQRLLADDRCAASSRRFVRVSGTRREQSVGRRGSARIISSHAGKRPETLLLDEPTSALDEDSARGVEALVLDIIRERRMICVIVTHNTAQARRISDRTMILEAGKLVTVGPTNEVLGHG